MPLAGIQDITAPQLIPINNLVIFHVKVIRNSTVAKMPIIDLPLSVNGSLVQKHETQSYSNCCKLLYSHTAMPWSHLAPRLCQIDLWAISEKRY